MLPGIGKVYGLASSFLRLLDDETQTLFQSFWHGLYRVSKVLNRKANEIRSVYSMDMRAQSNEIVSILISPVTAKPMQLNPLAQSQEFGIDKISSRPVLFISGDRNNPDSVYIRQTSVVCVDQILWSYIYGAQNVPQAQPRTYAAYKTDSIESIAANVPPESEFIGVVSNLQVGFDSWRLVMDDNGIKSFYDIDALVILDGSRYKTVGGTDTFVSGVAEDEYQIMVEPDFFPAYLAASNDVKFWITTGSDFQLDSDVIDVSDLVPFTVEDSGTETASTVAVKGVDFRFDKDTSTLEFLTDPWHVFGADKNSEFTVFSEKSEVSDSSKYAHYSAAGFDSRFKYNTTNPEIDVLGKAAWFGAQAHGNLITYRGLTSTYYGLPVAPYNGIVVGQFESYGYKVTKTEGHNRWKLVQSQSSTINTHLSGMILCDSTIYDISSGVFESAKDVEGKTAFIYIQGRYNITKLIPSDKFIVGTPKDAGLNRILPQLANCAAMTGGLPTMIVSSSVMPELNGWYHMAGASVVQNGVQIQVYSFNSETESVPLHHDHVIPAQTESASASANIGSVMIPYPSHKFLLIMDPVAKRVDRIWMDSPIFSSLNAGDHITLGQVMFETVVVAPASEIRQAQAIDIRRGSSGKLRHSNYIFEMVAVDPNADYGTYAPVQVQELD